MESFIQDGMEYTHYVENDGTHSVTIHHEECYSDEGSISVNVDDIPALIAALQKVASGPVHYDCRVSTLQLRARYEEDYR